MELSTVLGAGFVIFVLLVLVIGVGSMVLWVWSLIDVATRPDWQFDRARSNKVLWIVLIVVLGVVGSIVYLLCVRPRLISVEEHSTADSWGGGGSGWASRPDWPGTSGRDAAPGWSSGATAGWYDDPSMRHRMRYWDGNRWTDSAWDGGPVVCDPLSS